MQIFVSKRDDPIANDGLTEMDRENKWRFYIASYTSIDSTDGVDLSKVSSPFLARSMRNLPAESRPAGQAIPEEDAQRAAVEERALEVKNEERLEIRIAVNHYKAFFQSNSHETWHASMRDRQRGKEGCVAAQTVFEQREEDVTEKFEMNNAGMKNLSKEDVERKNADFGKLTGKAEDEEPKVKTSNEDVEMEG